MALYAISYDLHKNRDYDALYEVLRKWKAVRLLESLWLANLTGNAAGVRDALKAALDNDDSVAVIELKRGSDWACIRAKEAGVGWLRSNLRA